MSEPSSPQPAAPYPPPPAGSAPTADDRTIAMLIHLLAIVSTWVVPLVLWLVKKNESSYIDHHGKECINFQLTVFAAAIALFVASCVPFLIFLTWPAMAALGLLHVVFLVIAAVRANDGVLYRYPISLRLIS